MGFKIERTTKGWELAGVPERVLLEFSKRSEQVEQKAKELGATTAKAKDGLAALTRERKQKDISKAELRELWSRRVEPNEILAIHGARYAADRSASNTPRVSEVKAMDFAVQHCYERASIATDKELLRQAFRYGVGDVDVDAVKRQLSRDDFIIEQANGRVWLTTKGVLAEERRLIEFVQIGQEKFRAFRSSHTFQNQELSGEQRRRAPACCKAKIAWSPCGAERAQAKRR